MPPRPPRDRPHLLRLAALLCLFAGLVLLTLYAGGMWQGVQEQQRLLQTWHGEMGARHLAVPFIDPNLHHPVDGVDFAIRVPRLGYYAAVKEGISSSVLYASPGPLPADGLARRPGHVDLETRYGTYRYQVTGSAIVSPNNRSALVPDAPGHHLTLTTCWPLWAGALATQRFVIFSEQYSPLLDPKGST